MEQPSTLDRSVVEDEKTASVAESFARECREGLEAAKQQLPAILAVDGARTVENLLVPYNEMGINIEKSMATAGLYDAVHPDEKIRDEARACEKETAAFISELALNRKLYEAFTKVELSGLDSETQRLVKKTLEQYRRAGVDKDEATRKRLKAIEDEFIALGQEFQKTIVEDVRHIEIDAQKQPNALAGLPSDYVASHKADDQGIIKITTEYPDYIPFMKYADSGPLRLELYKQFKSRGDGKNEETLREILKLRAEKAKLLGYKNWADYITEDKMMGSGDNAEKFIARVTKTAAKRSKRDYKELLAWKRANLDKRAKVVEDWEKSYIENKIKLEKFSFNPQEVRSYFEYSAVQQGLLDITSKIYGIEYRADEEAELWHEDVSAYDVLRNGETIGRIYLDMHPREGKYGHAAQFTYRSGVLDVQVPEGVLVCNFPNPSKTEGKALMEHDQVVTMFHEFGHLMHHIFGGQRRWIDQSGVATEWDFVEAPSQMFEEWAWNHGTLSTFAKHAESGEPIAEDLVSRMRKAKKFGLGTQTAQQMFYAAISLNFHRTDPEALNMLEEVKRLQAKHTPFPYVEGTRFHTSFGHLNGYSAMYYTYMWSLVIAKDLLTPFQKHGLMNTHWTYKYRDIVLGQGGTKDAKDLVAEFLGREYNFKAFEKFLAN